MKKQILLTLLLGAALSYAQSPQIPLTGNVGAGGSFPVINSPGVVFASDANHTMAFPEMSGSSGVIVVTSSVSLTAARNLIVPLTSGFNWQIQNATTGGQSIVVIGASGTGVAIPNGATANVHTDGTNVSSITATSSLSVTGDGSGHGAFWDATEGTAPFSPLAGHDRFYADLVSHCFQYSANGASFTCLGSGGGVSPLTTKGDLYGFGTANARFPVGADGLVVTADSTQPLGLKWATPAAGGGAPVLVAAPTPSSTTGLQALGNAGNQVVHVIAVGDSYQVCDHVICGLGGGPVNPANRVPEVVRANLQAQLGSAGTGQIPLVDGIGASPAPINAHQWTVSGTYDTATTGCLGPSQDGNNTLVHLADAAVATFSDDRALAYSGGNVYFSTQTGDGTITVKVDGVTVGTASATSFTTAGTVNAGCTARILTLPSFASGTAHVVTFTSSGDTHLFAFQGTNGTKGVDVTYNAFGGAKSTATGTSAAAQNAFVDLIPGGPQIVYVEYLTNDAAGGIGTPTFTTNLTNIVNHYQALASAPTVILAAAPVSIVQSADDEAPYTAVITGLCSSLSLTCVNMQKQGQTLNSVFIGFGTAAPLSTNNWIDWTGGTWPASGNAGVHLSDIGSRVEGQLLLGAILNPFAAGSGVPAGCSLSSAGNLVCHSYSAHSSATADAVGYLFDAPGISMNLAGWTTGNGAGLAGVVGLYDNSAHFAWNTNPSDDLCGYTPIVDVVNCNGSAWKLMHTGDATFNTVVASTTGSGATISGGSTGGVGVAGTSTTNNNSGLLGVNSSSTGAAAGIPVNANVAPNMPTGNMADLYVGLEAVSSPLDFFVHGFVNIGGIGSFSNYGWLGLGHNIGTSPGAAICSDGSVTVGIAAGAPTCAQAGTQAIRATNVVPVYNASGTLQSNAHTVTGSGTLAANSLAVSLSGSAVFSSSSSYACSAAASDSSTVLIGFTYTSGSAFTILSDSATPTVRYTCTGN